MISNVRRAENTRKYRYIGLGVVYTGLTRNGIYEDLTHIVDTKVKLNTNFMYVRSDNNAIICVPKNSFTAINTPKFTKDLRDFETKDDWAVKHLYEERL